MFVALVDITEPICKKVNPELANMLSYDTSSVESYVTENNPKFLNSTINKLKSYYKSKGIDKSNDDIYKQAFKSLPKVASSDPSIKKMYAKKILSLLTLEPSPINLIVQSIKMVFLYVLSLILFLWFLTAIAMKNGRSDRDK